VNRFVLPHDAEFHLEGLVGGTARVINDQDDPLLIARAI
jgi:hypothetical protein